MRNTDFNAWPFVVGLLLSGTALAGGHEEARELRQSGAIVPFEQIMGNVRERHIGDILEAELESKRDRYYYEVEVLDAQGVVHKLEYDAATGELLNADTSD